jgi:hypothetical protein
MPFIAFTIGTPVGNRSSSSCARLRSACEGTTIVITCAPCSASLSRAVGVMPSGKGMPGK